MDVFEGYVGRRYKRKCDTDKNPIGDWEFQSTQKSWAMQNPYVYAGPGWCKSNSHFVELYKYPEPQVSYPPYTLRNSNPEEYKKQQDAYTVWANAKKLVGYIEYKTVPVKAKIVTTEEPNLG